MVNKIQGPGAPTSTSMQPVPVKLLEVASLAPLGTASAQVESLLSQGQVAEAVSLAETAVKGDQGNFLHWYRYGVALANAGRMPEAAAALIQANQRARTLAPNLGGELQQTLQFGWAPASFALAQLAASKGDFSRAVQLLGGAQAGAPDGISIVHLAQAEPTLAPLRTSTLFTQWMADVQARGATAPADGFDAIPSQFIPARENEEEQEKYFRVHNNMLLAAAQEAGFDPAWVRGLISDLSMGVVGQSLTSTGLEVLGATLLKQVAAENVDVSRHLGSDNERAVFDQVANGLADEIFRGSLTLRLIAMSTQLNIGPQELLRVLQGLLPADAEVQQRLGQMTLDLFAEQQATVQNVLSRQLTESLYLPLQQQLLGEWIGPELLGRLVQAQTTGEAATHA